MGNNDKFKCVIPFYGLSRELTTLRQVEVELNDGAGMAEVISAIKEKVPSLNGPVFKQGENNLVEYYKFNINGKFYFQDMDFQLHPGDSIALLVPIAGG
jgi:molybdopterin converting factor small subunit